LYSLLHRIYPEVLLLFWRAAYNMKIVIGGPAANISDYFGLGQQWSSTGGQGIDELFHFIGVNNENV
jgi:hypothetical protein